MQWMQCKSLWIIYAKCINVNATGYCLRVWWRQPKRIMCNDELSTVIIACWLKRSETMVGRKQKYASLFMQCQNIRSHAVVTDVSRHVKQQEWFKEVWEPLDAAPSMRKRRSLLILTGHGSPQQEIHSVFKSSWPHSGLH